MKSSVTNDVEFLCTFDDSNKFWAGKWKKKIKWEFFVILLLKHFLTNLFLQRHPKVVRSVIQVAKSYDFLK